MELEHIIIDKQSPIPIVEQIVNGATSLILTGRLRVGEKLPPERQLADILGVARGTVQRAYLRLAQAGVVEIRKGSGAYVITDEERLGENKKQEAANMLADTLARLDAMGLSGREIQSLMDLHRVAAGNLRKLNILVVSNNFDVLSELEKQLAYLSGTSLFSFTLTFFTLDHVLGNPDPAQKLYGYDLIIATTIDYPNIREAVPMYLGKTMEATISPTTDTLIELSGVPNTAKVSIVYRTKPFLEMVSSTLRSLGFPPQNVEAHQEYRYDPDSHGQNGTSVVVTFNECLINLSPAFEERNRQFYKEGGRVIFFRYRIDRASLIAIEDRIQALLASDAES